MSDDANPTRKDNGVVHTRVSVVTFTYNHDTHQVTISGTPLPLSLAQMIAGEGMRLLDEQRRVAAAKMLREELAKAQQEADFLAAINHRG